MIVSKGYGMWGPSIGDLGMKSLYAPGTPGGASVKKIADSQRVISMSPVDAPRNPFAFSVAPLSVPKAKAAAARMHASSIQSSAQFAKRASLPVQQAVQQVIQQQQQATPQTFASTSAPLSYATGGGGGGGGGGGVEEPTFAPPTSWWSGLGTVGKVAVVGGGAAAAFLGYKFFFKGGRIAASKS